MLIYEPARRTAVLPCASVQSQRELCVDLCGATVALTGVPTRRAYLLGSRGSHVQKDPTDDIKLMKHVETDGIKCLKSKDMAVSQNRRPLKTRGPQKPEALR